MSKPYHETPQEYVTHCRDAVKSQQEFITILERRKDRHVNEPTAAIHEDCGLCELLDDVIATQHELLTNFIERYKRSKKGIYD